MIRVARLVIVFWTPAAANSDLVKSEARLAKDLGAYLGIIVQPIDLQVYLRGLQELSDGI